MQDMWSPIEKPGGSISKVSKSRPQYFCGVPHCGKSYDRPAKLKAHLRSHSGEKPFQCVQCGKSFTQNKYLKVHEKSHLDLEEKPFVCTVCNRGCVTKQQFDRHMKRHEPISQLSCEHCGKMFVQKKSYLNHTSRHVKCDVCGEMQMNDSALKAHKLRMHSKRFHCTHCTFRTDTLRQLREHIHEKHNQSIASSPEVSFLTGLDYEKRRFACPYGCSQRFNRLYDVDRHLSKCEVAQHYAHSDQPVAGST